MVQETYYIKAQAAGGGGGSAGFWTAYAGSGGSGIVIIRYEV